MAAASLGQFLGVAALAVGGTADESVVADQLVARAAVPDGRPAVTAGGLGARVPDGVGERGLGDGLARQHLLCVAAEDQAKGGAEFGPGMPGSAGGRDVAAGVFAGPDFKAAAHGEPSERFDVWHDGV